MTSKPLPWNSCVPGGGAGDVYGPLEVKQRDGTLKVLWCELDASEGPGCLRWYDRAATRVVELGLLGGDGGVGGCGIGSLAGTASKSRSFKRPATASTGSIPPANSYVSSKSYSLRISDFKSVRRLLKGLHVDVAPAAAAAIARTKPLPLGSLRLGPPSHLRCRMHARTEGSSAVEFAVSTGDAKSACGSNGSTYREEQKLAETTRRSPPAPWQFSITHGRQTVVFGAPSEEAFQAWRAGLLKVVGAVNRGPPVPMARDTSPRGQEIEAGEAAAANAAAVANGAGLATGLSELIAPAALATDSDPVSPQPKDTAATTADSATASAIAPDDQSAAPDRADAGIDAPRAPVGIDTTPSVAATAATPTAPTEVAAAEATTVAAATADGADEAAAIAGEAAAIAAAHDRFAQHSLLACPCCDALSAAAIAEEAQRVRRAAAKAQRQATHAARLARIELAAYGNHHHRGGKRNRLTHAGEAASDVAAAKQKLNLNDGSNVNVGKSSCSSDEENDEITAERYNETEDGQQDAADSSKRLALARGGGYLHWQEAYRQFLDQDHREAIAQASRRAKDEATRKAKEETAAANTTVDEANSKAAPSLERASGEGESYLTSSSNAVWCPICAAPVPRQASLQAHMTTCAPKAAAAAPLCPTCRWPVPALDLAWHVAHACGGLSDAADQGLVPSLRPYPAPFPHGAPPPVLLAALRRYGPGRGQILDPHIGFSSGTTTSTTAASFAVPSSSSEHPSPLPPPPPSQPGTESNTEVYDDYIQKDSKRIESSDDGPTKTADVGNSSPKSSSKLSAFHHAHASSAAVHAAGEHLPRNPPGRVPCAVCGRKFATQRVATHQAICASLRHGRPPPGAEKIRTARGGASTGSGAFTVTRQRLQAQKWEQLVVVLLAQAEWAALKRLACNYARALDRARSAAVAPAASLKASSVAAAPAAVETTSSEMPPDKNSEIVHNYDSRGNSQISGHANSKDKVDYELWNSENRLDNSRTKSKSSSSSSSSIYSRPGAAWAVKLLRSTRARRLQAAAAASAGTSSGNVVLVRSPLWYLARSNSGAAAGHAPPAVSVGLGAHSVTCLGCRSEVLLPSLAAHQRSQCPTVQRFDSAAARAQGVSTGHSERHAIRAAGGASKFAAQDGAGWEQPGNEKDWIFSHKPPPPPPEPSDEEDDYMNQPSLRSGLRESLNFSSAWKAALRFRKGRSSRGEKVESDTSSDNTSERSSDNDDGVLDWSGSLEAGGLKAFITSDSETLRTGGTAATSAAAVTAVTAWERTWAGEVDVLQGAKALRQAVAAGSPEYIATAAAVHCKVDSHNTSTSNSSRSNFDFNENARTRDDGKERCKTNAPSVSASSSKQYSSSLAATSAASEEANFKRSVALWATSAANFTGGPNACSGVASAWWRNWGDHDQHRLATCLRLRCARLTAARLEQLSTGYGYSLPEAKSLLRTTVAFSLETDIAVVTLRAGTVDVFQLRADRPPVLLKAWTTASAFASGAPPLAPPSTTAPPPTAAASTVAPSETTSPSQLPTPPLPPTKPPPPQPSQPPPHFIGPSLQKSSCFEFGQLSRSVPAVEGMVVNNCGTIALLLLGPPRLSNKSSSGPSQTRSRRSKAGQSSLPLASSRLPRRSTLIFMDLRTGRTLEVLHHPQSVPVTAMAVASNGNFVATISSCSHSYLKIWTFPLLPSLC